MKAISLDNLEKSIQLYKEKNNSQLDNINSNIKVSKFVEPKSILESNKDIPVGVILEFLATADNEYYLPCDGSIYNIEDYPYLSQYFLDVFDSINYYGGDGITTFAVPSLIDDDTEYDLVSKASSNTTPEGIIIFSSEYPSNGIYAWKAFNKIHGDSTEIGWLSNNDSVKYIGFSFNKKSIVTRYKLCMRKYNSDDIPTTPKTWNFEAYDENIGDWIVLDTQDHPVTEVGKIYDIRINNRNKYRNYRIRILSSEVYASINELYLYGTEKSLNKYSIKYKPFNIDSMNRYSGLSYETLFEGGIYAKGEYKLASNSNNYDFIIVEDEYNDETIISETVVSPIMTSDTTPTPYIVSASGVYRNMVTYRPWKALNGTNTINTDCWLGLDNDNTGWIQIDLSIPTKVNSFSITSRNEQNISKCSPKDFTLQGSDDGVNFIDILTVNNTSEWQPNTTREYNLDITVNYRFYRINILSGYGAGYVGIGQFTLKYNEFSKNYNSSIIIRPSDDKVHVLKKKYNDSNIIFNIRDNKLNILDSTSDSNIHKIIKVVGIKGSIPSLLGGGEL